MLFFMKERKRINKNYSPEFKISVILDMREQHLGYREIVRKHWNTNHRSEEDLYVSTLKNGNAYILQKDKKALWKKNAEKTVKVDKRNRR